MRDKTANASAKLQAEVTRIRNLLSGLANHAEQIATEYSKSLGKYGKALEDELVRAGFERAWLRTLDDVGNGRSVTGLLFVSPDKREILRAQPIAVQTQVMQTGVQVTPKAQPRPIDRVSCDQLRQAITPNATGKPAPKVERVPVKAHIRRPPKKSDPIASRAGVLFVEARSYKWQELCDLMTRAIDNGTCPDAVVRKLAEACERRSGAAVA